MILGIMRLKTNFQKIIGNMAPSVKKESFSSKSGDLVKAHIEDARKEIKREKKRLKEREA